MGLYIVAIFHFSVKNISRSDGRSAVACAAYRSGEKLKDERYGKEQDYTKKTGIEFKNIYAPENTKKELLDRQLKGGIFSRAERLIMSFIILLSLIVAPQYTIYLIILMAVLSNIAAIQRIYRSLRL